MFGDKMLAVLVLTGVWAVSDVLGECKDKLTTCHKFEEFACSAPYRIWAYENCAKRCNMCDEHKVPTASTPAPTQRMQGECKDKLTTCHKFEEYACSAPYRIWAYENCAKRCNMCDENKFPTPTAPAPTQPIHKNSNNIAVTFPGECKDKLNTCHKFEEYACSAPYRIWAKENCAKRCNMCDEIKVTTATTPVPELPAKAADGPMCWQNYVGHRKGETWRNGCTNTCTCLDPSNNYITCRPLCWDWSNVVGNGCYMQPPEPGKCCPQPKCQPPSGLLFPDKYNFE